MNQAMLMPRTAAKAGAILSPIGEDDCMGVGTFLNRNLNRRISAQAWAEAMQPEWMGTAPNHGFMLTAAGDVVGAQLAFYSQRSIAGRTEPICNLAALCVHENFRAQSFMLIRAALAQPGYSFTDLSPSGNVRPLNRRLGFEELDTETALVLNLPAWQPGITVLTDLAAIETALKGEDLRIFRDHRHAQAARHVVLTVGGAYCYVIYRRDRRRDLPLFATLLHVGNAALLPRVGAALFSHLLVRRGIPFTLAELRVTKWHPPFSRHLPSNRVKMFASKTLGPDAIDYLNSELTCVAW